MDPRRAVADLLISSNNLDEAAWVCSLSEDDIRFTLTFKDNDQKISFWKKAYGGAGPGPSSQAVDNTVTVCRQLLDRAPTAHPVEVANLADAVTAMRPLPAKLPVLETLFNEWHTSCPEGSTHLEGCMAHGGAMPTRLANHVGTFLAGCMPCSGECGLHAPLDLLIRYLWGDLGEANGISLTIRRDKADSSSATIARKRPDVAVYLGNALVLKGEEKESSDELNAAASELLSKTAKRWSPIYFGQAPYIIAYAAGGHLLQWYALQRDGTLARLHPSPLDLSSKLGRVHAMVASVHCLTAIASLRSVLPNASTLQLFTPYRREHGTSLEATHEGVTKRIKGFARYTEQQFTRMEHVEAAYRIAEKGDAVGLVRPLQLPAVHGDVYQVVLEPGYTSQPLTAVQLFQAVRCVLQGLSRLHLGGLVHRDVRWANIVQCASGQRSAWALVDLETVWAAGESAPAGLLATWSDNTLIEGKYEAASDLRLVAVLMCAAPCAAGGPAQLSFEESLRAAVRGVTAADALGWSTFLAWEAEVAAMGIN